MSRVTQSRNPGINFGAEVFDSRPDFLGGPRPWAGRDRVAAANVRASLNRLSDLDAFTQGWFKGV